MGKIVLKNYVRKRIKSSTLYAEYLMMGLSFEDIASNIRMVISNRTKIYEFGIHEILFIPECEKLVLFCDLRILRKNEDLRFEMDAIVVIKDYPENRLIPTEEYNPNRFHHYYFDLKEADVMEVYNKNIWSPRAFQSMYVYNKQSLVALKRMMRYDIDLMCSLVFDEKTPRLLSDYCARKGIFKGTECDVIFIVNIDNNESTHKEVETMCTDLITKHSNIVKCNIDLRYFSTPGTYIGKEVANNDMKNYFHVNSVREKELMSNYIVNNLKAVRSKAVVI